MRTHSLRTLTPLRCAAVALPVFLGLAAPSAHAQSSSITAATHLTITPTYESTITATAQASIQSVINFYQSSFTNPINVNLTFKGNESISLGQSSTFGSNVSYATYATQLAATKAQGTDSTAFLQYVPITANNPVNGSTLIHLTTADQRLLGIFDYTGPVDSTISLKTSLMNLSRDPASYNSSKYDLQAVVAHEINEALGFGSGLNGLNNGDATPTGAIGTMDLYRYSANGTRSFDTNAATNAYFSVDGGVTNLVGFNQTAGGDFHDYKSVAGSPHVQDASGTPGSQPNLGVELTGLRDIGYNSSSNASAAPEPSEFAGLGFAAFSVLGLLMRAKKRKSA